MKVSILMRKNLLAKFLTVTIFISVCFLFSQRIALCEEYVELKTEIQKIEEKNKVLEEQLNKQKEVIETQKEMITGLSERLNVLEKKKTPITETQSPFSSTKLMIKGFADINYRIEDEVNAPEQNPNTFSLGQTNFFITSDLSDEISILNELVIEAGNEHAATVDIERLQLKYSLNELFNISIGRMHTPLGFWNAKYHHSTWVQTTANRPLLHNWEDQNGLMPNHIVGLLFSGNKDLESFYFGYDLGIANGRGEMQNKIQNIQDGNDSKALVTRISIAPNPIPGLELGFSTYLDKIPPDASANARAGEISELILGGHITYFKDKIELLAEVFNLNHDDEVSRKDYNTLGLYLQGAYKINNWKPYYRFDLIDYGGGDPYYAPDDTDIQKHTFGIRWDPITWNCIKLEYSYSERDAANDIHSITLQSGFAF